MLTFSILTEAEVTRRDIAGGLGGMIGRGLGRVGGGLYGAIKGLNMAGYTPNLNELPDGEQVMSALMLGSLGSIGGATAGGQIGKLIGKNVISDKNSPADFRKTSHRIGYLARPLTSGRGVAGDLVDPTGTLTDVGTNLYNAGEIEGANKVGYKLPGRIGSLVAGPTLTGMFAPDKYIQQSQKENKKK